ncbi:MAG: hypothetical protein WC003_15635, partial [Terrimicrobiaceae bacterium]
QLGGINSEFSVCVTFHSAKLFQGPQPNAHGTHADPDPVGDFFHREWNWRTKENPVNLSVRPRITKKVGQFGEN